MSATADTAAAFLSRDLVIVVTLACLIVDFPDWDPVPSGHTNLGEIYVSSLITRADRVITIAPIKTHRWTYTTAAMKNFVGATSFDRFGNGPPRRIGNGSRADIGLGNHRHEPRLRRWNRDNFVPLGR